MPLFLGIDGGGSKTTCAIGDETSVRGLGHNSGSNIVRVGFAEARSAIRGAIQEACRAAGVQPAQITRTCVGAAGSSVPEVAAQVSSIVRELVPGEAQVVGDMVIALEAAFHGGPGVITVAGTGSIAYGRNERGETARAGGWGWAVSDEGSGHWVGRQGVSAVLRAFDSGHSNALVSRIMNAWKLATRDDVARVANTSPPPDFAQLFPEVLSAAEAGDSMSREILIRAATELATLAKVVMRRLWPGQSRTYAAMAGGVFQHSSLVRQVFYNVVRAERPEAVIVPEVVEPVLGALSLARKAAAGSAAN